MPQCVVEKHMENLRASVVIKEMESQLNTLTICRWALRAFISITGAAMKAQNPDAMADFLDDGGCEALVNILSIHGGSDVEIAANGCLVVCILAWSLREMKEFLGEIGACEMVLYVISMHVGNPLVSEHGSGAIGLLSKGNILNSFRIAEADGCDLIAQVGNFGFNVRNDRCVHVAANVCYAIVPLCEAVNSGRLIECGACALVIELTKLHMKVEEFAIAAVKALCALSSLNLVMREELGKVGACEYVLDIVPQHRNPLILTDACETIMHLSLNPSNTTMLGECGACEVLVEAFSKTLSDKEIGCEVCTGGMLNMSTYGIAAKQNRFRLIDAGAVPELRKALSKGVLSMRTRENIMQLFQLLGVEDSTAPADKRRNSRSSRHPSGNNLVNIIHGSEMKGDTVPLQVEVRETVEVVHDNNNNGGVNGTINPSNSGSGSGKQSADSRSQGSRVQHNSVPVDEDELIDEEIYHEDFHANSTHEI